MHAVFITLERFQMGRLPAPTALVSETIGIVGHESCDLSISYQTTLLPHRPTASRQVSSHMSDAMRRCVAPRLQSSNVELTL